MNVKREWVIFGLVLGGALSRLMPHPWNLSPIGAIFLFSGAHFARKPAAVLVPFGAVFLSDLVIGLYPKMALVYLGYLPYVALGLWLHQHRSAGRMIMAALAGSASFFLITNPIAWYASPLYPQSFQGLMQAYVVGLPYYQNMILADVFFTGLLFGGFKIMERAVPALRPSRSFA